MKEAGEYAWLLEFEGEEARANEAARNAASAIRTSGLPGVVDVVPAARTVLVLGSPELSVARLEAFEAAPRPHADPRVRRRRHEIRMTPDGADLDEIASRSGLSPDAFLEAFVRLEFTVGFLGFSPGFAYLYGLPKAFHLPRRGTPRVAVPAGSVALAGPYVGIYPAPTPGGWNLLGRTARRALGLPRPIRRFSSPPGDRVGFPAVTGTRGLLVLEPGLLTTVQDLGRYGWASFGVPEAGALDEEALRLANRLVGNAESAAALEITLLGPGPARLERPRSRGPRAGRSGPRPGRRSASPRARSFRLRRLPARRARSSRSAAGSTFPLVLGSRSTCVSGRFGGFQGRRLQRGDFLPVLPASGAPLAQARADLPQPGEGDVVLRAFAGPDEGEFDAVAHAAFWRTRWKILPESNRMGLRLSGPSLGLVETASRPSEGTTRGTVQVTADGHPIVLLGERPTTGGYPKVAVVAAVGPRSPRAHAAGPKRAL